jgi:hypothetical protein
MMNDNENVSKRDDSTRTAVFLLSTERSGSNLLRSILNAHSEVTAPHPFETGYPWQLTTSPEELTASERRRLLRDILLNKEFSFHPLSVPLNVENVHRRVERQVEKSVLALQDAFYSEAAQKENASIWVSKYPGLWSWIDDANTFYDDLRIVYLVRDPRDVVLSFKKCKVGDYHPYFNAKRWREEQKQGIELLKNEGNIHLVRYEDVLTDSESEIEDVCEFLNIEFELDMLEFYKTEEAKKTADSSDVFKNVSSPIDESNSEKFRDQLPRKEIRMTEKVIDESMEYFGYERVVEKTELERFDLSVAGYEEENEKQLRRAKRQQWIENTTEELKSFLSGSFSRYMILRYGLLS